MFFVILLIGMYSGIFLSTKELEDVFKKLQELKSDPVGFGAIYYANRGIHLKRNDWHEIFQNATFNVNVKSSILKTGIMD